MTAEVEVLSSGRVRLLNPHAGLGLAAGGVLACEWLRGTETLGTSAVWPIAQALVASCGLLLAWFGRDRLRLRLVVGIGLAFQLAWIVLHLRLGVTGDHDAVDVYRDQGNMLLHGRYPDSEYPPGAVALFAVETWLGGGAARTANAFLMVPFQLVCVFVVWSLRTQWAPWLAAVVVASALVVRRPSELLVIVGACAGATTANTILFQSMLGSQPVASEPNWIYVSAVAFVRTIAVTAWLVILAVIRSSPAASPPPLGQSHVRPSTVSLSE